MKPLLVILCLSCGFLHAHAQTNSAPTNAPAPASVSNASPTPPIITNAAPASKNDASPTAVQIWGLILGAIGTIGTGIKLIEFYHDRARLKTCISLNTVSSEKFSERYFSLEIVFINRGRRPITMIEGLINLPQGGNMIMDDGRVIPVQSAAKPLFNAGVHAGLTIESHKRRVLVFEPFDALHLRGCKEKARAVFTDAIGNDYKVDFLVPPADHIDKIMANFPAQKQQPQNQKLGAQVG